MCALPVLPQRFAVVRDEGDSDPLREPSRPQVVEQVPDGRVRVGDLRIVGVPEAGGPGFGRGVRGVWVEEMNEEEEAGIADPVEPSLGATHHLSRAPFRQLKSAPHGKVVVPDLETTVQPEPP